jgi:ubiquitin
LQTAALPLGYPAESCYQSRFAGFPPFYSVSRCQLVAIFGNYANVKRQLPIVPYNGNRAYKYYLDGYKVNGKRKRFFFKDEAAADRRLAAFQVGQKPSRFHALPEWAFDTATFVGNHRKELLVFWAGGSSSLSA